MIRKMLVMVMLTLYSASAIGVPLHYHYCKGELQHITLFTQRECDSHEKHDQEAERSPSSCCIASEKAHCSMPDDPECCDDESDLIQLDDDQSAALLPFSLDVDMICGEILAEVAPIVPLNQDKGFNANAPPDTGPKIYLANCSFVFYG